MKITQILTKWKKNWLRKKSEKDTTDLIELVRDYNFENSVSLLFSIYTTIIINIAVPNIRVYENPRIPGGINFNTKQTKNLDQTEKKTSKPISLNEKSKNY